MSLSLTVPTLPQSRTPLLTWALFWVIGSAMLVLRLQFNANSMLLLSYDDLTRLSEVRDLLGGQAWFDTTQYRYNAPFGQVIHWSRLIDAPIAGLILLLQPLLGANAELATLYLWPLLLLGLLLLVTSRLCVRLLGPDGQLPGLILPFLYPPIASEFLPGRIDHHNVQMIIGVTLVSASLDALRLPRRAILAGAMVALSIAIGIEGSPLVIGGIAVATLAWVVDKRHAEALRWFGLTLAVATVAAFLAAIPPAQWLTPACDAISIVYLIAAIGTGAALVALSAMPLSHPAARLAAAASLGAIVLVSLLVLFPACRAGPYAGVDPWLVTHWLDNEMEVRPLLETIAEFPLERLSVIVPLVVALFVYALRLARRPQRANWLVVGALFLVTFLVTLLQVRGIRLAAPLAIPGGAMIIVTARANYLARGTPLTIAGLVAAWALFAATLPISLLPAPATLDQPVAIANAFTPRQSAARALACLRPESLAALAALPRETVMASRGLGPNIVAFTPHAVVEAPHHRNATGMTATIGFFTGDDANAKAILRARGATLVALCLDRLDAISEPLTPNWFTRLRDSKFVPDWLAEIGDPNAIVRLFHVR
ncbi:MAG: Oligosaccharyl transferase [Devosia sp.]|nr:Oligosaccharyl transferase [Devosia sp.]